MASSDSSFDIVSKVDMQEVKNAVDQAVKEIETRFDFKGSETHAGTGTRRRLTIKMASDSEMHLKSVGRCAAD